MHQRIHIPLWTVLLMAVLFSSCFSYKEVEVKNIQSVKIEKMNKDGIDVRVSVLVNNPNNYKISIVNSNLNLFLSGKELGKAVIKEKVSLPKKSEVVKSFVIHTNFKQLAGGAWNTMLGLVFQSKVKLRVKGSLKARAFMLGKKFPVDFSENVRLKDFL